MSTSTWIATRFFRSTRSGRFAPLLTAVAITGVAVGLAALVVVMSIMFGFRRELADRLVGMNAHITIERLPAGRALTDEEVRGLLPQVGVRDLVPFVEGEVIALAHVNGEEIAQGARVRGIDPERRGALERVPIRFGEGHEDFAALAAEGERLSGVIIGNEIVGTLAVHPDFDDALDLIAPLAAVGPTGEMEPNRRRYAVVGVFRSRLFDYDSKYLLMTLPEARRLLGAQAREGWRLRLDDIDAAPAALAALRTVLPEGWIARGLSEDDRKLFAALKLERIAMAGIMLMALLIASLAIAGVVLLESQARRRDMAILASLGLAPRRLKRIFLAHAAMIGGIGSAVGVGCGLIVALILRARPIALPSSYYLDVLPVEIDLPLAILFGLLGVGVALLAALAPVRGMARLSPAEVLRYE